MYKRQYGNRIDTIVKNIVENSMGKGEIVMSPDMTFVVESFHNFMYQAVYKLSLIHISGRESRAAEGRSFR